MYNRIKIAYLFLFIFIVSGPLLTGQHHPSGGDLSHSVYGPPRSTTWEYQLSTWKFDDQMLKELVGKQRIIFEKALSFLKPGGKIVYATCSILKEENQLQIDHFLKTYDLKLEGETFQTLPQTGGMDGFFAATFIT